MDVSQSAGRLNREFSGPAEAPQAPHSMAVFALPPVTTATLSLILISYLSLLPPNHTSLVTFLILKVLFGVIIHRAHVYPSCLYLWRWRTLFSM